MTRRLNALVIGNAAYQAVDELKNPVNDAKDIGHELENCGFTVIYVTDSDHAAIDRAIKRFQIVLKESDVGLFFFAGHGMQIDGENYLAAVDTDGTDEIAAKHSSLALNRVIEVMEKSNCVTNIIILDACRNNPFERAWTRSFESRGLAPVYAPRGTLIAYATSPGQTASDGRGRNGAYTEALLKHLPTPDCSIETMFKRVRNTLNATTKGKQISWEHTSLAGEFFFNLSLGVRIDLYEETALSDNLFVLDDAKASHRVIRELKSSTWPRQNLAVEEFTSEIANKASPDSLFVVGRNLYQAACGSSKSAMGFLCDFASRTAGVVENKRKALLDGMLFEVFFDPNAQLRKRLKLDQFEPLFSLQRHKELQQSFDFISECLLPEASRFHAIPGKQHKVAVDVASHLGTKVGHHYLESVHFEGVNIFWLEDEDYALEPGESIARQSFTLEKFERWLSAQMVVAPHLLKINYLTLDRAQNVALDVPRGWTARKR
ncbi:peptidase C14 [Limnohabitans sp. Rim8]|uniref:caspase family protein n=1 Tax=Limnohabitans sp. Rim8 TaxID=1100718 RepID=UPI000D3A2F9F|nr:caspase family protein [Limnohabitans sp. Rim8]PUE62239.1 peptidase C14 [Limnohabitans sp. Rim8]